MSQITTTVSKKPPHSHLEPAVPPTVVPQPRPAEVTELIRARAYQLYELRGKEEGHADEDWLRAEIEILSSQASKAAA